MLDRGLAPRLLIHTHLGHTQPGFRCPIRSMADSSSRKRKAQQMSHATTDNGVQHTIGPTFKVCPPSTTLISGAPPQAAVTLDALIACQASLGSRHSFCHRELEFAGSSIIPGHMQPCNMSPITSPLSRLPLTRNPSQLPPTAACTP